QPRAAARNATALCDSLQQNVENEIFRARKHVLAARKCFEANRFCHLKCSPAQIVSVRTMVWQLNRRSQRTRHHPFQTTRRTGLVPARYVEGHTAGLD